MKNFLFESIWIVSPKERRGRTETFHPRKNLIVGLNHTGKSSLIKTLFKTMGASPSGDLKKWDPETMAAVGFSVDGCSYRVVHQNKSRGLFDSDGTLIWAAKAHKEWSEGITKILGFNLVLTDKNSEIAQADLRCFFLPFYINQDGSWQAKWDTFTGMQQYRKPVDGILEYFAGIKPPRYYEIDSLRAQARRTLEDLRRERLFLEKVRDKVSKAIGTPGPKLQLDDFLLEVSGLTKEVTELNRQQEKLRDDSVREEEVLSGIRDQINLAVNALSTYDADSDFLRVHPHQMLTCPTCGAEHERPFLEILKYAEDARVLRELVAKLRSDAVISAERCQGTNARLRQLSSTYHRVTSALDIRRGELRFGDVVKSVALESAASAFGVESANLTRDAEVLSTQLDKLDSDLKQLTSMTRSKEILGVFRAAYAEALASLNLPSVDTSKLRLTSRPDLSGSGGPRSILAYYAALWRTCAGPHGSFCVPFVVDSPNQQGQDNANLPKVLAFIFDDLPVGSQVIVGSEIDTPHSFDKRIVLDKPYGLLEEIQYEDTRGVVEPLLDMMYDALSVSTAT